MKSEIKRIGLSCLVLFLLCLPAQSGYGTSLEAEAANNNPAPGDIGWQKGFTINGVDNAVNAVVVDGDKVYVAGYFYEAGNKAIQNIALWDGSAWYPLGMGIDDEIYALAIDGRGHLFAAGKFQHADGKPTNNIARWDGQEWQALGGGIAGTVYALAVDQLGNVYAGGNFTSAGDIEVNNIAMWDGNQWHALASGFSHRYLHVAIVFAISIDKFGFVYAAGSFTDAGNTSVNNVARWDGKGWSALGAGIDGGISAPPEVHALASDNRGNLYAGGIFTTAGGVALNIARWNGESWSALGEGVNAPPYNNFPIVQSILTDGGMVYVAGRFIDAGSSPVKGLARWNGVGWENINYGDWTASYEYFPSGEPFVPLTGLAMGRDGRLFAVGYFQEAGGKCANNIAAWDGASWSGLGSDNSVENYIRTMIPDGKGGMYMGGNFICAGGIVVNHIAHWDSSTWTGFDGGFTGGEFTEVNAMALDSSGNLYAGGLFTHAGVMPVSNIAKWTGEQWESLGSGVNGEITAMAIDNQDHLYVSGYFSTAGGDPATNIAEWTGSQWEALGNGLDQYANALAIDPQGLLVAGEIFNFAGDVQVDGLARWDGQKWESLSGGVQRSITSLAFKGDILYLGGDRIWTLHDGVFEQVGEPFYFTGLPPSIRVISFDKKDKLIVGGLFEEAGNVPVNNIACWNGTVWENLGSGTSFWGVSSLVVDKSGDLFVSGFFYQAGDKISMFFAQWNDPFYQWMPIIER